MYVNTGMNVNLHFTDEEIGGLGMVRILLWSPSWKVSKFWLMLPSDFKLLEGRSHFLYEQHCFPSCNAVPCPQ